MRLRAVRSVHTNKIEAIRYQGWCSSVSHFLFIKCLGKSILSIDFSSDDEKRKVRLQMVNPLEHPLNRYPLPRWDPFFPLWLQRSFFALTSAESFISLGGAGRGVATPPQRRMTSPCFLWDFDRFRFTLDNEDDAEGGGFVKVYFSRLLKSSFQDFRWCENRVFILSDVGKIEISRFPMMLKSKFHVFEERVKISIFHFSVTEKTNFSRFSF